MNPYNTQIGGSHYKGFAIHGIQLLIAERYPEPAEP